MDELRDLVPRRDPKGGSPRSPTGGVPLRTYQQYSNGNGNSTVWKVLFSLATGLLISMTVAYFTALRGQGISPEKLDEKLTELRKEVHEYTDKYSPYMQDKALISQQQSSQDQKIGEHNGKLERAFDRLSKIDELDVGVERSISDIYKKVDTITNYLEEEKKGKR